jgi:hypothetical protein
MKVHLSTCPGNGRNIPAGGTHVLATSGKPNADGCVICGKRLSAIKDDDKAKGKL